MRRLRASRSVLGFRNLGFELAAVIFPQARRSFLRQGGDRGAARCSGAGRSLDVDRALRREVSGLESSLTVFFAGFDPVFERRAASTEVVVSSDRGSRRGRWLGGVDWCFDLGVAILRHRSRLFFEGGSFEAAAHDDLQPAVFTQTSVDGWMMWVGRPPELMAVVEAEWQKRVLAPARLDWNVSPLWAWVWAWVSGAGVNFRLMGQKTLAYMKKASKKEKVKRVSAGMSSNSKGKELVIY